MAGQLLRMHKRRALFTELPFRPNHKRLGIFASQNQALTNDVREPPLVAAARGGAGGQAKTFCPLKGQPTVAAAVGKGCGFLQAENRRLDKLTSFGTI